MSYFRIPLLLLALAGSADPTRGVTRAGAVINAPVPDSTLGSTRYIDSADPSIREVVARLTSGATDDVARAVRLHDFVRDSIAFGFAGAFYDQRASEVLRTRRGFCNTKSTLFVALLRAAGIPARQHFVTIDAAILQGVLDPRTSYVDHSYTEVLLEGAWRRTDSYIVDPPLFAAARTRLLAEGRTLGYGIHRNGTTAWDGRHDAFSQFVDDGAVPTLSTRDHGIHADVGAFYATGQGLNALGIPVRWLFPLFARSANGRLEALRRAGDAAAAAAVRHG